MTEKKDNPYMRMSLREVYNWVYLQKKGSLPDRKPYDMNKVAPTPHGPKAGFKIKKRNSK